MSEASIKIGRNHAYLQQFLKRGIPEELKERERESISALLGIPEQQLRGVSAPLPKREYVKPEPELVKSSQNVTHITKRTNLSGNEHNLVDGRFPIPLGVHNLPIFGTAQGGQGALIVTDHAIDYEARPDFLLKVEDAYGMIVTGESMEPEFKNGSTALVNPHLPPRNGDTCIFRSHKDDGEVLAMIKRLVRFNDKFWFVRQHNPRRDFVLKRSEWQICHVTVGSYFRH